MKKNARTQRFPRRFTWLTVTGIVASITLLAAGCSSSSDQPRQISDAEAKRLSEVRVNIASAEPVSLTVKLPEDTGGMTWKGHVDWSQPLVQAVISHPDDPDTSTWLQGGPTLVATRTIETDKVDVASLPTDGWRTHHLTRADGTAVTTNIVLSAIMSLAGTAEADTSFLRKEARWVRDASIDGAEVDVFRAPLLLSPNTEADTETNGQAPEAMFWIDNDGQLRRLSFRLTGPDMATVDFLLNDDNVPELRPVSVLGGSPIEARAVTETEATMLSGLRQRSSLMTADVTIEVPDGDGELVSASGYLDWSVPRLYLVVDRPGDDDGLLYANAYGVANRKQKIANLPPVSPEPDGWEITSWSELSDSDEEVDNFDLLLYRLLALSSPYTDDYAMVTDNAAWLKSERLAGVNANVYEFPLPGDTETDQGTAPFRYWIAEEDQQLQRVEMKSGDFGLAHADITTKDIPEFELPDAITQELG